jgi:hypothetical protein
MRNPFRRTGHELAGTAFDPDAHGYELQGRDGPPVDEPEVPSLEAQDDLQAEGAAEIAEDADDLAAAHGGGVDAGGRAAFGAFGPEVAVGDAEGVEHVFGAAADAAADEDGVVAAFADAEAWCLVVVGGAAGGVGAGAFVDAVEALEELVDGHGALSSSTRRRPNHSATGATTPSPHAAYLLESGA